MLPNAPLTDLFTAQPPLNAGLIAPPNPLDTALNLNLSSSSGPMSAGRPEPIALPASPISRVPLSILARFGLTDRTPRPITPVLPPNVEVIGLPRAVPTPTSTIAASPIAVPPIV
jgi:hypothetical protein